MKVICKKCDQPYVFTVFPLISAPGAYLISKLSGVALLGVRRLRVGGAYFKVRGIILMIFQIFAVISFKITINEYNYDV